MTPLVIICWIFFEIFWDDYFQEYYHCVKNVQIRSFFWSVFSCIPTEYGDLRSKSTLWALFTQRTVLSKMTIPILLYLSWNIRQFSKTLKQSRSVCGWHICLVIWKYIVSREKMIYQQKNFNLSRQHVSINKTGWALQSRKLTRFL